MLYTCVHGWTVVGVSETRLGDFWKFLATNLPTKVGQIFANFLGFIDGWFCCSYHCTKLLYHLWVNQISNVYWHFSFQNKSVVTLCSVHDLDCSRTNNEIFNFEQPGSNFVVLGKGGGVSQSLRLLQRACHMGLNQSDKKLGRRITMIKERKSYFFCPSSIRRRDTNPRPSENESSSIITRPGLPPNKSYFVGQEWGNHKES